MKKCPKNCGLFPDYESICPKCRSRLLKVKDSAQQSAGSSNAGGSAFTGGNSTNQTTTNNVVNNTHSAGNNDRGYSFDNATGNTSSPFSYDKHIYGMQQNPINQTAHSATSTPPPATTTYNTNPNALRVGKGTFRGRVKNIHEDSIQMGTFGKVMDLVHGVRVAKSDKFRSFQLIELDSNDNTTGIIYSVILKGDITSGHFYDGNILIVEGKRIRTGEIYARNVYNETANCAVKIVTNLLPF